MQVVHHLMVEPCLSFAHLLCNSALKHARFSVLYPFWCDRALERSHLCCSEMAPPHLRGRFNQLYQLVLTLFILVAQVINLIINLTGAVRWGWRLSLGFAFVPALILFLGGVFLPDSPNSLLERGFPEQVWQSSPACLHYTGLNNLNLDPKPNAGLPVGALERLP